MGDGPICKHTCGRFLQVYLQLDEFLASNKAFVAIMEAGWA